MTEGQTHEVLTTKVQGLTQKGDFVEVLLLSSPVRYRLDRHRRDLRQRLEVAQSLKATIEVLVDWECQEILELL